MKIHTLKKQWILPALCCSILGMTSESQAAVIVSFEQVGSDVVATWNGSIDLGSNWINDFTITARVSNSLGLYGFEGSYDIYDGGTATATTLASTPPTTHAANLAFGFQGTQFGFLGLDDDLAPANSVAVFNGTQTITWSSTNLTALGADSFNNTLAWTSEAGGSNTVSYTTVIPEPSSIALMSLAGCGVLLRRRRS